MTQTWKTELSPPRKKLKIGGGGGVSFKIILQGRLIFYIVEEEKDKGRHVDANVTIKGTIASHPIT